MRLICDNMPEQSASLGSPGIDELRWRKPVFPGDVLRVRSTITDKRASRSRPEMGSVFILNEVINQNDVVVMSYSPIVLYKRRT
jgi:acyl dehydratase